MTSQNGALLTEDDRALLLRVNSLLEEVIESFDILNDKETMMAIREAEEDLKTGKVRSYEEFFEELKKSAQI